MSLPPPQTKNGREVTAFVLKATSPSIAKGDNPSGPPNLKVTTARGRSSTTASVFPIGANRKWTAASLTPSPTVPAASFKRPLPSPPRISVAPAANIPPPNSASSKSGSRALPSSPALAAPSLSRNQTPSGITQPRSRTQSASSSSRTPLSTRPPPLVPRNAATCAIDAAHNTLVIRPAAHRSLERKQPVSNDRSIRIAASPERRRDPSPERRSLAPRSESISHATPSFIASRQSEPPSSHSRMGSISNTKGSSPPSSAGLRLNTSFTSLPSAPPPHDIPPNSLSSRQPHFGMSSKSRTLPHAPIQAPSSQSHLQNNLSSPFSHPPGAMASPTSAATTASGYLHGSYSLNTPDSTTVPTPDTTSTSASLSLATPDSIRSAGTGGSYLVARRAVAGTDGSVGGVRIRRGSLDESIEDDDDMQPSIPSQLKGKGKASDSAVAVLRVSRSLDVDSFDGPAWHSATKKVMRPSSTSSSASISLSEEGQSFLPVSPPHPPQHLKGSVSQRPQPRHLVIPASISDQQQSQSSNTSLHGVQVTSPSETDDYPVQSLLPSPKSKSHPHNTLVNNNTQHSSSHPYPHPSQHSPTSTTHSSEDGEDHSHPAALEDMISLAPPLKTRESGFYFPPNAFGFGLTFSGSVRDSGRTSYSPIGEVEEGELSPFSAKPGSESDGIVFSWKGKSKKRRQSWGSPDVDTMSTPASPVRAPLSATSPRERSLSPIRYAKHREDEEEPNKVGCGFLSDVEDGMDDGLNGLVEDDDIDAGIGDVMEVEREMEFAYSGSDTDQSEDDGGLDVLGMPRGLAHRSRRLQGVKTAPIPSFSSRTKIDLAKLFDGSDDGDGHGRAVDGRTSLRSLDGHEFSDQRQSRSRSRRGPYTDDGHGQHRQPPAWDDSATAMTSSLERGPFPTIQSKVLSSGRARPQPPGPPQMQDLNSGAGVHLPFGRSLASAHPPSLPTLFDRTTAPSMDLEGANSQQRRTATLRKPPQRAKSLDASTFLSQPAQLQNQTNIVPAVPSPSHPSWFHHNRGQGSVASDGRAKTPSIQSIGSGSAQSTEELAGTSSGGSTRKRRSIKREKGQKKQRDLKGKLPFGNRAVAVP